MRAATSLSRSPRRRPAPAAQLTASTASGTAARDALDRLPAKYRSGSRLGRDLNHLEIGRESLPLKFRSTGKHSLGGRPCHGKSEARPTPSLPPLKCLRPDEP